MTQTYFPFDSGAGANVTEVQWQEMAQHFLGSGIIKGTLNDLQVIGDSTGMQVKAKSGAVWIKGHYYKSDAEETLAIGSTDATNPRIDRVIIRLDWTENTIQLAVLQGTAATSPTAPALTQNTSRWEIALAQVTVNAGATTITASDVTDEREFARLAIKALDADGKKLQQGNTGTINLVAGGSQTITITFPEPFAEAPYVLTQIYGGGIDVVYYLAKELNNVTSTQAEITVKNNGSTSAYFIVQWTAIGK